MRPWLFITLFVSFSFVVWVYYSFFFSADCLFVWLGCGTRHAFPFPFCFCAVTAEAKYIFCTHNSLICKTLICKTILSPTQNSHICTHNLIRKVLICKAILSVTVSGLTIQYLCIYVYLCNELHSWVLYF